MYEYGIVLDGSPPVPVLDPWVIVEPYVGGATRVVAKRNPYFWQVDPDGSDLGGALPRSAGLARSIRREGTVSGRREGPSGPRRG